MRLETPGAVVCSVFLKNASSWIFTPKHGEIHISRLRSHSASAAYEQNLSASEPEWTLQRFQEGKLLRTAGWSYVERLSSLHVCILLESCPEKLLFKYLELQMTWFKLTFTDSPQRVILCSGIANFVPVILKTQVKYSAFKSANDISKQWLKCPVLTFKLVHRNTFTMFMRHLVQHLSFRLHAMTNSPCSDEPKQYTSNWFFLLGRFN